MPVSAQAAPGVQQLVALGYPVFPVVGDMTFSPTRTMPGKHAASLGHSSFLLLIDGDNSYGVLSEIPVAAGRGTHILMPV